MGRRSSVEPKRVQTGLRIEPKMLKVLKALAEYLDLTLAELVEMLVLQAFENAPGFSRGTLKRVEQLKRVYDMSYGLADVSKRLFHRGPQASEHIETSSNFLANGKRRRPR